VKGEEYTPFNLKEEGREGGKANLYSLLEYRRGELSSIFSKGGETTFHHDWTFAATHVQ